MFEKEAKKRAKDFTDNEGRQIAYECGFLDGADRMRGEMQKQGLALQSDMDKTIEQNCVLKKRIEKMKNLEEDNADLKQSLDWANEREKENIERIAALEEANTVLERRIERAKRCMKKLMFIINSDPANYNCKGLMQDAEDFIHNRICNIRQLGEHCISETRCIMCDMEDKKMTKDEMKNRISLALKNPNLQQGFEIICKNLAEELVEERIAELEQEKCELLGIIQDKDKAIKELEEKLAGAERTRDNLRQLGFPTFQSCKEYAEHIAELEKESKFYYEERCNYKVASLKGFVEKNKINKALTKAKELLKWALHSDPEHDEDFDQKWEEAEQFLKEGEENGI